VPTVKTKEHLLLAIHRSTNHVILGYFIFLFLLICPCGRILPLKSKEFTTTFTAGICDSLCSGAGPVADVTDAPQPYGFLCNPMMKKKRMIIFCPFRSNGAPVE
jgi:hypothetical protein